MGVENISNDQSELTSRSIRQQQTLPTFESEENEKGQLILPLFRIVNLREEAEMIVTSHRIIVLTEDVGKGIANISTLDDGPRFLNFPGQEQKGELFHSFLLVYAKDAERQIDLR